MRYPTISVTAFITFILTVSIPVAANFPTLFQVSQVSAQTLATRKAEADRLLQQSGEQLNTSQFTSALQSLQQALIIYQEIKDRHSEGVVLGNIGVIYFYMRNDTEAINYHKKHLEIARQLSDRTMEAKALGGLAYSYESLQNHPQAIKYLLERLLIVRKIKDKNSEAHTLRGLGYNYITLGEYSQAIDYVQQSLVIATEINNRTLTVNNLGVMGMIYQSIGDYSKAIEYHQKSLNLARKFKLYHQESNALGNLGLAYFSLKNYSQAIDFFRQNLVIAQKNNDRQVEGKTLGNLGTLLQQQGEYNQAITYHKKSLVIAREFHDLRGEGQIIGNLAFIYSSLGDYPRAINLLQQRLAIARKIKDSKGEGYALGNLGITFLKSGNLIEAEKNLRDGIKVWEATRNNSVRRDSDKVSIFEEQTLTYSWLQQVLIAQNKTDTALEISERGRARAFVELLTSRLSSDIKEQFPTLPTITEIKQIAQAQNATLVQYSIIYDDFKFQGKQKSKESELYIWVIKPTGKVTFRKTDIKPLWQKENTSLAELVTTSRQSIGARGINVSENPNVPKAKQKFRRLHELLIEPIADLLPSNENERVIFVPQGELFLVPFPALQNEEGKYLIEKHTILTAPSIQVLNFTHRQQVRSNKSGEVLVVGNPKMPEARLEPGEPPQQLSNLKWAEKEAKEIASLFETQAITGDEATESAIVQQMTKARIIHLATHGIFDDFRGLGSAIALAPSNQNDGLLTAEEIFNLKLNADLVVLSACDTGRGRITGDGVIGLSRSFISAGVPSVIVSLWAVDDSSTSILMTEFYQNLQQNLDKAIALRKAILTTMKKYPSPKYWAAFTLIGEAE
ncbi:CHAT domain-containing protein [Halotia wernerae UHCC 0503]|nr:CHAT domain-containing protein [Halotia wernerae UHCC 0503]